MADSIEIILDRNLLTDPSKWNAELKAHNIPVNIYDEFNPLTFIGNIPCTFQGKKTGVEYFMEKIDPNNFIKSHKDSFGNKNTVISLTMRDGFNSSLSASAIAAAIASLSEGIIIESDELPIINSQEAFKWVKDSINGFSQWQEKTKEAKKEVKKLKRSPEKTLEKLHSEIEGFKGYKSIDGMTADICIALIFEKNGNKKSISFKNWEYGNQNGLLMTSYKLKQRIIKNENDAQVFYDKLGDDLDDASISEILIDQKNNLNVLFDNGIYINASSKDDLRISSNMFSFTLTENYVEISA